MMDFPVFLNKWVIGFKSIRYTPFWFWFRLVNHSNWRMDDHQRYWDFWLSINRGYDDMQYQWEFEKFWGKNTKPETIVLSQENYDSLVEKLNEPPQYDERIAKLLQRKDPWDT